MAGSDPLGAWTTRTSIGAIPASSTISGISGASSCPTTCTARRPSTVPPPALVASDGGGVSSGASCGTRLNWVEDDEAVPPASERAKAQMEKGAKAFEDMNAFGKGNVEAIVESSKIAARGFEQMGQDAASYMKSSYESATGMFRSMAAIKSPTELFKLQSDYARASFDAFVAEASRSTEAALKLAGEIAQPISNRVALAAEKIKVAA